MILSAPSSALVAAAAIPLAALAAVLYLVAAVPLAGRLATPALGVAWLIHGMLLVIDIGGIGLGQTGARLGFAPVLSLTVWLVIAVHAVESRLVPLPAVRKWLALGGLAVVLVCAAFPGEVRPVHSPLAPLHFALGVGAYALFGVAVLHALMLDAAERRLRGGPAAARAPTLTAPEQALGMPLLQLERVTFRFVEAGFIVLSATLLLGIATMVQWRWGDHKAVFSIMAWGVFAALLAGRRLRGWRGRRAMRWLYAGALLLLLAYVGSRFVVEVLLHRPVVAA